MRREITYYVCTPCENKGKEVKAERILVDGRTYDLCAKDRKLVDQYVQFRDSYAMPTARTVRNGHPGRKQVGSATAPRRFECGACLDGGEPNVIVANNSRSWHAGHYHGGKKLSELNWHEV